MGKIGTKTGWKLPCLEVLHGLARLCCRCRTLPTFTGTADSGSTVTIYSDGVAVGSGVASGGAYSIVPGLSVNDFSRERMQATYRELCEERDGVKDLI